MQEMVEQRDHRARIIKDKIVTRRIRLMLKAFKRNRDTGKREKEQLRKEREHRFAVLTSKVFSVLKQNWSAMRHIKSDKFLKQALIDGEEFFTVDVGSRSGTTDLLNASTDFTVTNQRCLQVRVISA